MKYLNNLVEQDHRFIKRLTKPGMGFFSFETAWRTLQGFEMMNMIRKGQLEGVEKGDVLDQIALVNQKDCRPCPSRSMCTKAKYEPQELTLRPQEEHIALQTARQWQKTEAFKEEYAQRAGIEGTLSQAIRAFELRKSRYLGLAKTHLQHLLTAAAVNLVRADAWLTERPRTKTRTSRFAALATAQAC